MGMVDLLSKAHARERDRIPRSSTCKDKVLRRVLLLLLPLKIKND